MRNSNIYKLLRKIKPAIKLRIDEAIAAKKLYCFQKKLKKILAAHSQARIVIFPSALAWNIPLFQRPQQIALAFAKYGFLCFYCTSNPKLDKIEGFKKLAPNLYLTDCYDLVSKIQKVKIYDLMSSDFTFDTQWVQEKIKNKDIILYEYIDELDPQVLKCAIPDHIMARHEFILREERCFVVATSTQLYNKVKGYRNKHFALVPNAVDYRHWQTSYKNISLPKVLQTIAQKQKIVIGYFGVFASWFDYELIRFVALARPEYEWLLIGWDFDGSLEKSGIKTLSNITVMGPIPYTELPKYSSIFNVSTIPRIINEVTQSMSPVKLFEYMAIGKPIVATAIEECNKYRSVLVASSHIEFLQALDKAVELQQDHNYQSLTQKEAEENTWESRAQQIAELLKIKG